jgi:hypothetical protein
VAGFVGGSFVASAGAVVGVDCTGDVVGVMCASLFAEGDARRMGDVWCDAENFFAVLVGRGGAAVAPSPVPVGFGGFAEDVELGDGVDLAGAA